MIALNLTVNRSLFLFLWSLRYRCTDTLLPIVDTIGIGLIVVTIILYLCILPFGSIPQIAKKNNIIPHIKNEQCLGCRTHTPCNWKSIIIAIIMAYVLLPSSSILLSYKSMEWGLSGSLYLYYMSILFVFALDARSATLRMNQNENRWRILLCLSRIMHWLLRYRTIEKVYVMYINHGLLMYCNISIGLKSDVFFSAAFLSRLLRISGILTTTTKNAEGPFDESSYILSLWSVPFNENIIIIIVMIVL